MGTMRCLYDLTPSVQIFYDHVNPATRRTIDQAAGGKLRDKNAKESCKLLEDLALYDNESWNDPRDFAKPVKAISLPQDVPSTSNRRLIELENQVQRLMEAHLAPKSSEARLSKFEADFKQQQGEMTNKIDTVLKAINDRMTGALLSDTVPKLNVNPTSLVLSDRNKWESEELIKKKIDWNKPPKEGDRAWHIRIELINPDEERLKKTFQSIPTTRMLSEKENPREIINLDRFHDF
ncbi:hypothetical protein Tco_1483958 [Tanacetum coccineum]